MSQVNGHGRGKVTSWAWRTATTYSQLRTNKGALQAWKFKIDEYIEDPECRNCGKAAETGDHLVFAYEKWEGRGLRKEVWIEKEATVRKWRDREDLDSGNYVIKEKDAEGKLIVRGLVTTYHVYVKLCHSDESGRVHLFSFLFFLFILVVNCCYHFC